MNTKFKVWDKDFKKFVDPYDYYIIYDGQFMFRQCKCTDTFPVFSTCQTDKNGAEIYEGDILEYQGKLYNVHCVSAAYGISTKEGFKLLGLISGIHEPQIKIIGTKYENPELLETKPLILCPSCKKQRGEDEHGAYICPCPHCGCEFPF